MSISLLLEMASSSDPDRTAVVSGDIRLTTDELSALADGGAGVIAASGAQHVAYVGTGGAMLPLLLFSAARAAVAVTPLNYRLSADGLRELIDRLPTPLVIADAEYIDVVAGAGKQVISSDEFIESARYRRACRRVRRPRRDRRRAVHLRHHLATQGRRADAQQSDELRDRHRGIRVGVARGRGADLCAALSHRGCQRGAVQSVCGPKDGVPHQVRPGRVGPPGGRRGHHHRNRCADDARSHRRLLSKALRRIFRRCGTWHTADRRSRCPLSARRSNCCPAWVSSTHTASPRPVRRSRCSLRTTTGTRSPRRTMRSPVGLARSANRYPASRCRSGPTTARFSVRAKPASCSSAATRCRAGTPRSVRCSTPRAGSPPKTLPCLTKAATCSSAVDPTTRSSAAARTSHRPRSRTCSSNIPHVHLCAVVGPEDPQWGQIIVAVVVPTEGADPDPDELREYVRKSLRGSRTPDRVVFRDELPTTATGKMLRRELVAELRSTT